MSWPAKAAKVQVEQAASSGSRADKAPWGTGRLTLTALHLNFVPASTAPGVRPLSIRLTDIESVETNQDRFHKVVTIRTAERVVNARVSGASAFAQRLAVSVEADRRRAAVQASWDEVEQSDDTTGAPAPGDAFGNYPITRTN